MSAVVDPNYRPLGLESDATNRNFSGAHNPDDALWVQFAQRPVQNNYRTQVEGRPIFEDQLWIEIRMPGGLNIIERPAMEADKRRFLRAWQFYEQTHGKDGAMVGTPLSQWPLLRPAQIEELRALRFYSVEQVANASDEALQRMGMLAGMAPSSFRERARSYLLAATDSAAAAAVAAEKKALEDRLAAQEAAMREQAEKHAREMEELKALISAAAPKGRNRAQEQQA